MTPKVKKWIAGGTALLAAPVLFLAADNYTQAADHNDPPSRVDPTVDNTPDRAADIADIYGWHSDTSLVFALNFGGPNVASLPAVYDRNVLYTINLSNDADRTTPEFTINFRFGEDPAKPNRHGIQITGLPGSTGPVNITGPVETNLEQDGIKVRAGLFDDPFNFDSAGLRESTMTGALSFRNTRNFFGGKNTTTVVVEIPRSRLENGTNPIAYWGESARFGGNI